MIWAQEQCIRFCERRARESANAHDAEKDESIRGLIPRLRKEANCQRFFHSNYACAELLDKTANALES